jgi:hypothetical protein
MSQTSQTRKVRGLHIICNAASLLGYLDGIAAVLVCSVRASLRIRLKPALPFQLGLKSMSLPNRIQTSSW